MWQVDNLSPPEVPGPPLERLLPLAARLAPPLERCLPHLLEFLETWVPQDQLRPEIHYQELPLHTLVLSRGWESGQGSLSRRKSLQRRLPVGHLRPLPRLPLCQGA
jgi:hypothetical protein